LLKAVTAGELTIDQATRKAVTGPLADKLRAAHQRAVSKPAKAPKAKKSATRTANTTVRVGRWVYPGIIEDDGSVFRNSKTDGSGEWVALKGKAN
jgi:hypothetical protein